MPRSKKIETERLTSQQRSLASLRCGNLRFSSDFSEVYIVDKHVRLTKIQTRLLVYLAERRQRVIPRREILSSVWKGRKISDRTVDSHISSLREKLKGFDHVIETVHGVGYSLKELKSAKP